MSGHNRWSQIQHKKGITDQKRGQLFSKFSKIISIAARDNPDPDSNPRLQSAIEQAKQVNMPKENIERAIKRAVDKEAASLNEVIIQAIGPSAVAIIIKAITDNSNRTVSEVKNILSKNEAKMVGAGSLNWMFDNNWNPHNPVEVTDESIRQKLDKLFEELNDHDDVEDVFSNLKEISSP